MYEIYYDQVLINKTIYYFFKSLIEFTLPDDVVICAKYNPDFKLLLSILTAFLLGDKVIIFFPNTLYNLTDEII